MTKYYPTGPYRCIDCFQLDNQLPNDHSRCKECKKPLLDSNTKEKSVDSWWYALQNLKLT